jgi:hypothetical protein
VTANPSIRFLLLCGKESKVFRPGQSLGALIEDGVDEERRIMGAEGYDPVLPNVPESRIGSFRRQVELVDWTGEDDPGALEEQIAGLAARNPGRFTASPEDSSMDRAQPAAPATFVSIRPGGRRQPLQYDPKGYFVITIDREAEQIVLQHYLPDHTPAHEMRGRVAESISLGLLREELISQLSHASYIGAELAKAEAALHLDLRYRQDRPLTHMPGPAEADGSGPPVEDAPPAQSRIAPALTLQQLLATDEGATVDVVFEATDRPSGQELSGVVLEPDEKEPFSSFRRTGQRITAHWSDQTRVVMGEREDVVVGGIFRVRGECKPGVQVDASVIVVLSRVAAVT